MLSLQYLIFTILAIYAYLEWRKSYAKQSAIIKIAMFGPEVLGKQRQFNQYYKTVCVPEFARGY
jgi:hypothetical protein